MPRWVISSPIHISRIVPAVSDTTISRTVAALKGWISGWPWSSVNDLNRNT